MTAKNALAKAPGRELAGTLSDPSFLRQLERAVPSTLRADRLARVALTALRQNRDLAKTTPASFFGSLMLAAQLGLEPNTPLGHCYLIPRRNGKTGQQECTLLIGYQGHMDLVRRSGLVRRIWGAVVYRGDDFAYQIGSEPKLHHVPAGEESPDTVTHAYACADVDGHVVFAVVTRKQIDAARSIGGNVWGSHYAAMAQKTAILRLRKWLPQSIELARAEAAELASSQGIALHHADPDVADALTATGIAVDEPDHESDLTDSDLDPESPNA